MPAPAASRWSNGVRAGRDVRRPPSVGPGAAGRGAAVGRGGCHPDSLGALARGRGAVLGAGPTLSAPAPNALLPGRGRRERLNRGGVARLPPADLVTRL